MPIITQSVADVARTLSEAAQTGKSIKVENRGEVKTTGWFRADNHDAIIRSVVRLARNEKMDSDTITAFAHAIDEQTRNGRGFVSDFHQAAQIIRSQEAEVYSESPTSSSSSNSEDYIDDLPLGAEATDIPPVPPRNHGAPVPPRRFESLARSLVEESEPQAVPEGMFDDPVYGTAQPAPQTTKGTEDTWNHFRSGIQQSGLMSQRPAGADVDTVENPAFQEATIEEWLNMRKGPGAEPPTFPKEDVETIVNPDYESSVESIDMDAIMSDVLRNRGQQL